MAKLTKKQAQLHRQACELVEADRDLDEDEKEFVLDHWQESSTAANSLEGAFFTPRSLARDLSVDLVGMNATRILDLGAGTGRLAFECRRLFAHRWNGEPRRELVCVERNPAYLKVGRKVLPEATWIGADILDLPTMQLGKFDAAIGNPPFGAVARTGNAPGGYRGRRFEYHAIAIAALFARYGVFLVPQTSAPFRSSGQPNLTWDADEEYQRFHAATGLELQPGCGWDTSHYADDWHGVSPTVEIVTCDLTELSTPATAAPGSLDGAGQLALLARNGHECPRPVRAGTDQSRPHSRKETE
ncbi:N-6 DNA methylase [Haloechinothrix halophila]|uniref:N-6 DNA methylase n=1 Tax=Haloechinothrix halophila TaxID=1069073 RepID=UPI000423C0A9|nr:N-6 DNA methylase [Haloechinothrix halophila]